MFGESESESPRVPSPWDSLISTPPESSRTSSASPSPLSVELIPRLVPEADEGNVEYKLQLLSPSPARFARLVTQLKWRLLEGGGQAYYELGVADSGALVGLPRAELEQSLETLEMMAGEIGASVIVVKEIEVPAAMAGLAAAQTDMWNGQRKQREARPGSDAGSSTTLTTETETDDLDSDDLEDMSTTVVLDRNVTGTPSPPVSSAVSLAPDLDPAENADVEPDEDPPPYVVIDLEIASVFKPRPMRARMQLHALHAPPPKAKRLKRIKHITHPGAVSDSEQPDQRTNGKGEAQDPAAKALTRRQMRDRKREEKRKALLAYATAALPTTSDDAKAGRIPTPEETSALVSGLASLHVSLDGPTNTTPDLPPSSQAAPLPTYANTHIGDENGDEDEDDVFASPTAMSPKDGATAGSRLIVEALIVRKMSLDEAFLDFGGFAPE